MAAVCRTSQSATPSFSKVNCGAGASSKPAAAPPASTEPPIAAITLLEAASPLVLAGFLSFATFRRFPARPLADASAGIPFSPVCPLDLPTFAQVCFSMLLHAISWSLN